MNAKDFAVNQLLDMIICDKNNLIDYHKFFQKFDVWQLREFSRVLKVLMLKDLAFGDHLHESHIKKFNLEHVAWRIVSTTVGK